MKKKNEQNKKQIIRKPKLSKEFRKSFLVIVLVILITDLFLSILLSVNYINTVDVSNSINSTSDIISKNNLDMTNVEMKDGILCYKGDTAQEQEEGNNALALVNYYCGLINMSVTNNNFMNSVMAYISNMNGKSIYDIDSHYYVAYFNSDGKQIANCDNGTFIFMRKRNEGDSEENYTPSRCFRFNEEALEKTYPGLYQEIKAESDKMYKSEKINQNIGFEDIYVNGPVFLAKKIVLRNMETGDIIKCYDIDQVDMTGYVPFANESGKVKTLGPIVLDFNKDNPSYNDFYNEYDKKVEEVIKSGKTEQDPYDNCYREYDSIFAQKGYDIEKIPGTDSLYLVVVKDLNFFRDFAVIIIPFYIITLILAVIISYVWAKLRYSKKLVAYEMDAYRRKTTNTMAHDLKSPLMAISGYAENIINNEDLAKDKQYANSILDTVHYMDQMIASILNLAKLEDEQLKLNKTEVSLNDMIIRQQSLFEKEMEQKGLNFHLEGEKTIIADAFWIEHMLNNLMSNAIKYATADTVIQLQLTNQFFTIKNEFDKELKVDVNKLKEAFVKGDNARANESGNGLGLSIVDQIATAHGYKMNLKVTEQTFIVEIVF